ncbi:hypothetical protein JHFBIEKO_1106 [Methylobacterium mesophilicum]|jgi:hypothetical protein|uniref:hypothetical protein n=1 Tax=Methylobacterium mesophilicum TaxID=39956 RepID=UPI0011D6B578|nr:hypothetical protein [Methylobacterium mesophilicum]TXN73562.1 hypothetical protein FV228_08090 [Methylobacterium sp. WL18]GJE20674.1 hypothetical protein JHFBIEKO_1106 [Methylobacterium mesophilicum]
MALSEFPRTRPTEPDARTGAGEDAARAETARRNFERVAALIAAANPLDTDTDAVSDLDLLEAATALSTQRT